MRRGESIMRKTQKSSEKREEERMEYKVANLVNIDIEGGMVPAMLLPPRSLSIKSMTRR